MVLLLSLLFLPLLAHASASLEALEAARTSNISLLWVPRPNVYFGTKPRLASSLITGLLWTRVEDYAGPQNEFRHSCEQGDGMAGYGWEEFDVRNGGKEKPLIAPVDPAEVNMRIENPQVAAFPQQGLQNEHHRAFT